MTRRPDSRDAPKPRPDHRRGMFIIALAAGGLFAFTRIERETAYILPGFSFGLAPFAMAPEGEPATATGAAVLETVRGVETAMRSTHFAHETEVDEERGIFDFDASGFVGWVLARAAPVAFATLGRDRPVAEDFARVIHDSPLDEDERGWRRLSHPSALMPGDVVAWSTPQQHRRDGLTGHVAIVTGMPVLVPGMDEAWSVRVADSSDSFHQWDSRLLSFDLDGGVGEGIITFAVAEDGHVYAYGLEGPWSPMFHRTDVELGRVLR